MYLGKARLVISYIVQLKHLCWRDANYNKMKKKTAFVLQFCFFCALHFILWYCSCLSFYFLSGKQHKVQIIIMQTMKTQEVNMPLSTSILTKQEGPKGPRSLTWGKVQGSRWSQLQRTTNVVHQILVEDF